MHPAFEDVLSTLHRLSRLLPVGSVVLVTLLLSWTTAADDNVPLASPARAPRLKDLTPADWKLLDWKYLSEMTPEEKAIVPRACCGAFIEPVFPPLAASTADGKDTGDSIAVSGARSEMTENKTIVIGDVIVTQGQRRIRGDRVELYDQPRRANLNGHVVLHDPGFLLQGTSLATNIDDNIVKMDNARYVIYPLNVHGTADEIVRHADGIITLKNSTYSACTPGDESWYLKSSSMTLDPDQGQGTARNVRIEVGDVPVFYIPYLEFPLGGERQSGFLAPSFINGSNGMDVTLPYYFNLAPNYDATLIPRIISDHGAQLGGEFRYLSPLFKASTTAAWLPHDQQTSTDRWLISVNQTGGMQQPWSTRIDFTRVSDRNYFTDLDNVGLGVTRATNLTERASTGYLTDHWDSTLDVVSYQSLLEGSTLNLYQKLPGLSTTGEYVFSNGTSAELTQSVAHFRPSDPSQVGGDRLAARYQLGWRSDTDAGYIAPDIEMNFLRQQLDSSLASQPQVAIPAADVNMGITLEHDNPDSRQIVEPHLHYRYVPYRNQDAFQLFDTDEMTLNYSQLFQDSRFSGNDRIGDANQVAVGVSSRWLDQATGNEWLQAGIGQVFYRGDRRVTPFTPATFAQLPASYQNQYTNGQSPLLGGLQWALQPHWNLNSELAWDEAQHHTQHGNVFLHYHSETQELFSIGYRYDQLLEWTGTSYVPDTVRQADISSFWPLNNQWALTGRAFYDFTNHRYLENLFGFQYEDCCWRWRTFVRHWAVNPENSQSILQQRTDTGLFFEIEFKSLAGTGTKTSSLLRDSIYGYSESHHEPTVY